MADSFPGWEIKLTEAMRTHAFILITGGVLLVLLSILVVGAVRDIINTVRLRSEQQGRNPNPVMDRFNDDEPVVDRGAYGEADSVAFARKMAQVKVAMDMYNSRLTDLSVTHGVDVRDDALDTRVYQHSSDEYERPKP